MTAQKKVLTPQQAGLLAAMLAHQTHVVSKSTAGSGKSDIIRQYIAAVNAARRVVYFAFNKNIVKDQQKPLGPYLRDTLTLTTVHAYGLFSLTWYAKRVLGRRGAPGVDMNKGLRLAMTHMQACGLQSDTLRDDARQLAELVAQAMNTLCPAEETALRALCVKFKLSVHQGLDLVKAVSACVAAGQAEFEASGKVSFNEMLYLPLKYKLGTHPARKPGERIETALVDEAQDLSALQLRFVEHMTLPDGLMYMLGDNEQCIFGFNGADPEGMDRVAERLNAQVHTLSVSFRCPKSHVALARQYSDRIEARPGAREGLVLNVQNEDVPGLVGAGDLIICRTNAPAMRMAMTLLGRQQPVAMFNAKLQERLTALAAAAFGGVEWTPQDVAFLLGSYAEAELRRLHERAQPGHSVQSAVEELADELGCVAALAMHAARAHGAANSGHLAELITKLFDSEGVRITTIHGAKGLEAQRVVLMQDDGDSDHGDDAAAKRCLDFVGSTRSTDVLAITPANAGGRILN